MLQTIFDSTSGDMQVNCSTLDREVSKTGCCANCGIAAVDEIKLKPCPHCDFVQYCSDKCQQDHRELHEESCKQRAAEIREEKRAAEIGSHAEIRDEILFKQPESTDFGDCPICFLPMPLDRDLTIYQNCCGKLLCVGCTYANTKCALNEGRERKCPFCRKITPASEEESMKRKLRRLEANDPIALQQVGHKHYDKEEYENSFRYLTRAAELDNEDAHFLLGLMYFEGKFVEEDTATGISHWETAAIRGHVRARFMLGGCEWVMKRFDRAVKHCIISASLGDNESIKSLTKYYKEGHVSKDDFARALRAHQAAVDAMKSPQREEAELIVRG